LNQDDILDSIFSKAISGKGIFKDPSVLKTDYIPQQLLFRDNQVKIIGEVLSPLLRGSKCSNLLLYGKTGTGKTAASLYVLRKLKEKAIERNLIISFPFSNARVAGTEYRVLTDIAEYLDLKIPFTGLAVSEVAKRVLSTIEKKGTLTVIILDEVDYLVKSHGSNLLYELTRANERLQSGFISIIGISNDLNFKDYLDPRVISSLSEEEIVFPPYTVNELKKILAQRAENAFHSNSISSAAINLCAALAGAEHGDARRAIDLMRVSAEIADRENSHILTEDHVRTALQKIEEDRITDSLKTLPIHPKILLLIILLTGDELTTGEVYSKYRDACKKIGVGEVTQRRASGILNELQLIGLISTEVVSHGRYGRTKKIQALIHNSNMEDIVSDDPILKSMIQNPSKNFG